MLTVSRDGEEPTAVKSVVLYDNGVPIAAAVENGGSVIWADSIRDPQDLLGLLQGLGVPVQTLHKLAGGITTDPTTARPVWKPQ